MKHSGRESSQLSGGLRGPYEGDCCIACSKGDSSFEDGVIMFSISEFDAVELRRSFPLNDPMSE